MELLIQLLKIVVCFFLLIAAISLMEEYAIIGIILLIVAFIILGYDPVSKTIWNIKR